MCLSALSSYLSFTEDEIPASKLKNFFKSVAEHKDITKLLMVLASVISSSKAEVMTCLDSFTKFRSVWDEDKEKAVAVSVCFSFFFVFCFFIELFSKDCRRTNTKVITPTNHNRSKQRAMNQSEFLAVTCMLLQAREKSRLQGAICFGFAPHWLRN